MGTTITTISSLNKTLSFEAERTRNSMFMFIRERLCVLEVHLANQPQRKMKRQGIEILGELTK